MKNRNLKSGSALLIVLGMLSFMVISAIGFSVFMRQNRLPSSFVRRNTTANQLLKAALAKAMNEIDSALGDEEFPGIAARENKILKGTRTYIDNTWKGRVFLGSTLYRNDKKLEFKRSTGDLAKDNEVLIPDVKVNSDYVVSTLSMEGLAYLPPCLVNDVRYFSQHTPTARWHNLGYDAGRFAYTAVNVSDYFDVNEIDPDSDVRTFAPSNRVSLAYMFDDAPSIPDDLVSLADMNLAMAGSIGKDFTEYAKGAKNYLDGYYGRDSLSAKYTLVANSAPKKNKKSDKKSGNKKDEEEPELLDLNDTTKDSDQPFSKGFLGSANDIVKVWEEFKDRDFAIAIDELMGEGDSENSMMGAPFAANLYDYLDEDSVPVSLAIPSVEAVPMIAGVKLSGSPNVKMKLRRVVDGGQDPIKDQIPGADGETRPFVVKYYLDYEGTSSDVSFDVETFFPFSRSECSGYKIEAAAQIVWGPSDGLNQRGKESQRDAIDMVIDGLLDKEKTDTAKVEGVDKFNRYVFQKGTADVENKGYPSVDTETVKKTTHPLKLSASSNTSSDAPPFAVINEEWTCTLVGEKTKKPVWKFKGSKLDAQNADVKGLFDKEHNRTTQEGGSYLPYLVFRVSVTKDNDCVDLAPASIWDDALNAGGKIDSSANSYANGYRAAFVIKGPDAAKLSYTKQGIQALTEVADIVNDGDKKDMEFAFGDFSIVCPDPRWNHNVDNWEPGSSALDRIRQEFNGVKGKDSDVFMSVSNSKWLNSIAELAFLPRTKALKGNGRTLAGLVSMNGSPDTANFAMSLPLTKDIAKAGDRGEDFWLCDSEVDDKRSLESLFEKGDGGIRINPYSDDPEIFLAAIADSPCNWAAATPPGNDSSLLIDNQKTAEKIASEMQNHFASPEYAGDWITAFNSLDWGFSAGEDKDMFKRVGLGSNLLHSSDKKFLYGFWKGCFDVRQQLFIIFVRAEPTVFGGGAAVGKGGRAVAVVWRDPKAPESDIGKDPAVEVTKPHEMRVLFYKVLE